MKDREKGTLVQRQRYTLPSRSLQYWPMNHCVRNTTYGVQYLKIFLIIFLLQSGMENSIIQELNAEEELMFNVVIFFSVVICLLIFTNHASIRDKICLWNILSSFRDRRGAPPPEPPAGVSPPDPRASLHLYSLPRPTHHRMPAIIKVTQAANFHVLIG